MEHQSFSATIWVVVDSSPGGKGLNSLTRWRIPFMFSRMSSPEDSMRSNCEKLKPNSELVRFGQPMPYRGKQKRHGNHRSRQTDQQAPLEHRPAEIDHGLNDGKQPSMVGRIGCARRTTHVRIHRSDASRRNALDGRFAS